MTNVELFACGLEKVRWAVAGSLAMNRTIDALTHCHGVVRLVNERVDFNVHYLGIATKFHIQEMFHFPKKGNSLSSKYFLPTLWNIP